MVSRSASGSSLEKPGTEAGPGYTRAAGEQALEENRNQEPKCTQSSRQETAQRLSQRQG